MRLQPTGRYSTIKLLYIIFPILLLAIKYWIPIYLPPQLSDTVTLSLGVFFEALPFVLLGVFFATIIQLHVKQHALLHILPSNGFLRRSFLSIFGIFMPVCECGNVPLARGLMVHGLRPSDVMTFLLAAPILNPITIYTTMQAFPSDPIIVVSRVVGAFIIAHLIGWVWSSSKDKDMITENFSLYCDEVSTHKHITKQTIYQKIQRFSTVYFNEFQTLLPSLIFGSVVAGIIQTSIPRSFLISIAEQPVIAIIAMMLLAAIVSICANVDAFFALSLSSIFPTSAIIAFLVFGPMIDIKLLALLRTTYTKHVLFWTTLLIFFSTLTLSLVVQYAF